MGMGNSILSMVIYMKDHMLMANLRVMENIHGKMAQYIKVNFYKDHVMEKG
jgi:hypothetical protein